MSVSTSVNSLSQSSVTTSSSSSTSSGTSSVDLQDQFLTLLVAQLKNQDPTNPMDNSQLTTQLAQINTLGGIEKLNTTLSSISGQINSGQSIQNTLLIGHGVLVPGNAILVGDDSTTTPFGFEVSSDISQAVATISDSTGNVVATLDLGAMNQGTHTFQWDGKADDDSAVPAGKYTVSISAKNGDSTVTTNVLNYAMVYGVTPTDDGTVLNLGTYGTTTLDQIKQIL